jgi:2-oxoglutarate dehydrogenase E2 component (dihydrolipoamide succinyltransferase)
MSRRRQTIARRLVEAQHTAAMLTTFNEVDMSALMALRNRRKEAFHDGDEIVLKHYYDIGVAIGAPDGLVVPVLRDADRMNFAEISRAIQRFADQAEANSLSLEDLRGGTFTLSPLRLKGRSLFTP